MAQSEPKRQKLGAGDAPRLPPITVSEPLAAEGLALIALAEENMAGLVNLRARYAKDKPFAGLKIGVNLHVTKETAVLIRTLQAGGAELAVTGCNAFSTQDAVAAALATEGVKVYARHGCTQDEYAMSLNSVVEHAPRVIIDDGCDLTVALHKQPEKCAGCVGGCEQTTSGVIRLRNMAKAGDLQFPVVATNENKTKNLLDNFYGTGQSVVDGVLRATTMFIASKTVVCVGYGHCGKGMALRFKGLGAKVLVTEVDPFAALQAVYDGFTVLPIEEAAKLGDVFVTVSPAHKPAAECAAVQATSNIHAIDTQHVAQMRNGAILCNAGQFVHEINLDGLPVGH